MQSIEVAAQHQPFHRLILVHLRLDFGFFGGGKVIRVQLVACSAEVRNRGAGSERRVSARLVIGAHRNMARHRGQRIAQRSAVLNGGASVAVAVIARPDLRKPPQNRRVETAAAARAALENHVRERADYALEHFVKPQHIVVMPADFAERAIHIPLDVVDCVFSQHARHRFYHEVANLGS